MASDDNSRREGAPPGPIVLRIKLRYDTLDVMVQRFAPNVGKSGLFLPTKSIQPVGAEVKFELRLANDTPALVGIGRVKHVKPPDPTNPKAAFGMAIELMRVSREGREVIIRMIERRRAMGLADVAIPIPEDLESSRRAELESQPRADTSGIVREAMAQFASAPVAESVLQPPLRDSAPAVEPRANRPSPAPPVRELAPAVERVVARANRVSAAPPVNDAALADESPRASRTSAPPPVPAGESPRASRASVSPPVAAASVEPESPRAHRSSVAPPVAAADADSARAHRPSAAPPVRESAPLLTAPRSTELGKPVPALAPEPPRAKRLRLADVIAKAESGPVAAAHVPELDEHVDVERALARARMLATGDLDAELAAVRESAAAPIEISVEAASAELARQLGGSATTKRDRSARWAPPPAVVDPTIALAVETAPPPAPPEPAPPEPASPARVAEVPAVDPAIALAVETAMPVPVDEPDDAFAANASTTTAVEPEATAHPPMLIDDESDAGDLERAFSESDRLNTGDILAVEDEPVERTMIAAHPADAQLADQLDRQLDEAEQEADADVAESLRNEPSYNPYGAQPQPGDDADEEEVSELDVLAEADENDADLLQGDAGYDDPPDSYADAERTSYGAGIPSYAMAEEAAYGEAPVAGDPAYAMAEEEPAYAPPVQDAYGEAPVAGDPAYAMADEDPPYALPEEPAYEEPMAGDPAYAMAEPEPAYALPDEEPARPSSSFDFAANLDLEDSLDRVLDGAQDDVDDAEFDAEAAREFDREAAREFDADRPRNLDSVLEERPLPPDLALDDEDDAANEFMEYPPTQAPSRLPTDGAFSEQPSASYTFAEPFPQAALAPTELDDGARFTPGPPAVRAPAPQPGDLEDALAALDVDDDPPTDLPRSTGRPLPGLPAQRPTTGPVKTVANTMPRATAATLPATPAMRPPARPPAREATRPPPVPAAALRKPPTQQLPVAPPTRATTDDGILIEFDDDE